MFENVKEMQFIRHVLSGDIISEDGLHSMNIYNKKACVAGSLYKIHKTYFVFSRIENYTPERNDIIIGRIFSVSQEYYKVNFGAADLKIPQFSGILPVLSFENATKRNKPELEVGDIVLTKIIDLKSNEALLSCQEKGLGRIENYFKMEPWKVQLLHFTNIQREIEKFYKPERKFKVALAMNGYVNLEGEEFTNIRKTLNKIFS